MRKRKLVYVYWPNEPQQIGSTRFSTPEIRVYAQDEYHAKNYMVGENLFDLTSQCDSDRGFGIKKSYSLTAKIRLDNYNSHYAMDLMKRLTKGISFISDKPLVEVVKRLKKLHAKRYIIVTVRGSRELVPRKHARHADKFWDSVKNAA